MPVFYYCEYWLVDFSLLDCQNVVLASRNFPQETLICEMTLDTDIEYFI